MSLGALNNKNTETISQVLLPKENNNSSEDKDSFSKLVEKEITQSLESLKESAFIEAKQVIEQVQDLEKLKPVLEATDAFNELKLLNELTLLSVQLEDKQINAQLEDKQIFIPQIIELEERKLETFVLDNEFWTGLAEDTNSIKNESIREKQITSPLELFVNQLNEAREAKVILEQKLIANNIPNHMSAVDSNVKPMAEGVQSLNEEAVARAILPPEAPPIIAPRTPEEIKKLESNIEIIEEGDPLISLKISNLQLSSNSLKSTDALKFTDTEEVSLQSLLQNPNIRADVSLNKNNKQNADISMQIASSALISSNNIASSDKNIKKDLSVQNNVPVQNNVHLNDITKDRLSTELPFSSKPVIDIKNKNSVGNAISGNNSNSAFIEHGGMIESKAEDSFQIAFKENLMPMSKNIQNLPKPAMQVSLAINEVLEVNSSNAKKILVINLFPESLGQVKVEILSVAGKDGVKQIDNIKFIADKKETLVILESAKEKIVELTTKATNIKEETSLEFEMNQGERGQKPEYFANAEERDLWMSQFHDLSTESDMKTIINADPVQVGYINQDSVNIKV